MAVEVRAGVQAASSFTAASSPTRAFAGAVSEGDLLVIAIRDGSDETTTITSVTDSVNGAWTAVEGPLDHGTATFRGWLYCFPNSGAGTPTVTVNFSGAINGHLAVAAFSGAQTSATPDAEGTSRTTSSSGDTTHTSNAVTNSAAGALISAIFTAGSVTLTASTGTDTIVTTTSTRAFIIFTAAPTSSSKTQAVTSSSGAHSIQTATAWLEAGGGGGGGATHPGRFDGWW